MALVKFSHSKRYVRGRLLEVQYLGVYVDPDGKPWDAFSPTGITLSAWKRLEPTRGGRARMVYDPGSRILRGSLEEKRRTSVEWWALHDAIATWPDTVVSCALQGYQGDYCTRPAVAWIPIQGMRCAAHANRVHDALPATQFAPMREPGV